MPTKSLRYNLFSTTTAQEVIKTEYSYPNFSFDIIKHDVSSKARTGLLTTPHGIVETPAFVFCATKAAMKAVTPEMLRAENTSIILSNTYHLMLTPGSELVRDMGGMLSKM